MKQGQYILDRWMVGMIREICQEQGIAFASYSDDWLLELTRDDETHRVIGYKFDISNSVASTIAGDKVAAYQVLNHANIPAVEHRLVRTKATEYSDWTDSKGEVVVKPLDGTSGHAVALLSGPDKVESYISRHQTIAAWAVSPYQDIQFEHRFIVMDGSILCQYEKQPVIVGDLPMFNLGLGATAIMTPAGRQEAQLAESAVKALDLRLAAVDVIMTNTGPKVLEVNDGIMMENFMRQAPENKQLAYNVYEQIIARMFGMR